ncbi:MAG: PorT family protein [Phycisphaerae bacterium]|nr:PorT family protein [Gemmatimonadaceae bacterium]
MNFVRRLAPLAGAVALMSAALPLHAQRFGIMAGATFSNLRSSEDLDLERRNGTIFGATLQLPLGAKIALQPELLFLNKGAKFRDPIGNQGNNQSVRLDYLEIPVLLRYDFSREVIGPHIYAGPSIGFNLNCQVQFGGNGAEAGATTDCGNDDFKPKTLDYGLTVGAGVDLNLGGLALTTGVRYGLGLADIRNDDSDEFQSRVNNGTVAIYLGVLFGSLKKD